MIKPSLSLEDMLLTIARDNGITKFFFNVFSPLADYEDKLGKSKTVVLRDVAVKPSNLRSRLSYLREYAKKEDALIGILSPVEIEGGKRRHLNLLDVDRFPWFRPNDELMGFFKLPHGFLLNSGSGYHFYGRDVVTEDIWRKYLLRAKRDFDERWAQGQLKAGASMLRLTSNSIKEHEPYVIACSGYRLVKI